MTAPTRDGQPALASAMQRHDDLNVPLIVTWGSIACIVTFAIVLAIQVLYYQAAAAEEDRKVIAAQYEDSDSILASQEARLTRYGWLDRAQGQVTIPIQRAMQIVVEELERDAASR